MKLEYLVLVTNDDSFCNSKKAFIDFLKVDSCISIVGKKLTYKKTPRSNPLITVKFDVETNNIPSNKERYFIIALENEDEKLVDEFSEVGNKIKELSKRINPDSTIVNILWDDVGRHFAYKAYPLINDVENVMRKLISKFMLINVGMDWSKETIHPDLVKKIERFEEEDIHLNDLYKLDFINLSEVLFQKKRDTTLEELDRTLSNTAFDDTDRDKILKYLPRSNWEKYFSELLGHNSQSLEKKWSILYKLRNKVAHNRFLTRSDFEKIKGLSTDLKDILITAINKLGEIDLNEEDRNQIIHSYQADHPSALAYRAEKSIAEYFMRKGYLVEPVPPNINRIRADFIIKNELESSAVEIKVLPYNSRGIFTRMRFNNALSNLKSFIAQERISRGILIFVLKGNTEEKFVNEVIDTSNFYKDKINEELTIELGTLDENDNFELIIH